MPCLWRAQQAMSGRISTRMAAVEQNQAEFRLKLSDMLLSQHNNETALKACESKLESKMDNLATMMMNIMNKLESRTIVSEPNPTVNNGDVPGGIPKSTGDHQVQSRPTRIGTSITLPIDVVDDTDDRSQNDNRPKVYTRMTRSKDAKLKGVTVSQENSHEGSKGPAIERTPKKAKVVKGGVKKRVEVAAVNGMPITVDDGKPELGGVVGTVLEHGSISPTPAVDGSGVEDGGEVVGKVENTENKPKGLVDVEGGITEVASGAGESLGGEKGRLLQRDSDHVEEGDVGVLAEVATLVESTGKAISPESASQNPKTLSPSKVGDIGGSHNTPIVQVSPPYMLVCH